MRATVEVHRRRLHRELFLSNLARTTQPHLPRPYCYLITSHLHTLNSSPPTKLADKMATRDADLPDATDPIVPKTPKILTLNVGGRGFTISADILEAESGLFRHQL